jgi:Phage integrase, N-terminal SAM-like domain
LLDQVRDVIRRKHYSIRTEQSYIVWIRRLILFHGTRHPLEMGEQEVTAFLSHLARNGGVAASISRGSVQKARWIEKFATAAAARFQPACHPHTGGQASALSGTFTMTCISPSNRTA